MIPEERQVVSREVVLERTPVIPLELVQVAAQEIVQELSLAVQLEEIWAEKQEKKLGDSRVLLQENLRVEKLVLE